MALSLLHPGSPFDPSIKYYSPHRTLFILLPPYLIFLLLDKDIGLSPTYFTTIQTACTLYLHHNFLRFHTTCEWAWIISPMSGAQKSPAAQGNLWLSGFNQRSTSACVSFGVGSTLTTIAYVRPFLVNAHSSKNTSGMGRPTEASTRSLVRGRQRCQIISQLSFITRSIKNLMGMCRGELWTTWLNLTVSHLSTICHLTQGERNYLP